MSYTKLSSDLIRSTIWLEDLPTKVVWITLLALSNAHGEVMGSVPGLARDAGVTIEQCQAALAKLLGPDPYSRSKEHDGRRILEIDGGWALVNYAKYRASDSLAHRRELTRERVRRLRERQRSGNAHVTQTPADVTQPEAAVTQMYAQAEAEAEAESESESESPIARTESGVDTSHRARARDPSEVDQAVQAYNETARNVGWSCVQRVTPARRSALAARMGEAGGLDGWRAAMAKAEASDFLTGRTGGSFRPSLDWLCKLANFTKLMEGNYDNRPVSGPRPGFDGGRDASAGHPERRGFAAAVDSVIDDIRASKRDRA